MIIERYTCLNNLNLFKCRELNLKEFIEESQYYKDDPNKPDCEEKNLFIIPVVIEIMDDKISGNLYGVLKVD